MRTNPQTRTYFPSNVSGVAISWRSDTATGLSGVAPGSAGASSAIGCADLGQVQIASATRQVASVSGRVHDDTTSSFGNRLAALLLRRCWRLRSLDCFARSTEHRNAGNTLATVPAWRSLTSH